ncbi:hypothetical protein [Asticcacaulis excentricus]|uniref:hypothetical protein n=1 Tax=Asticcacaulis excentricus TaxID=78587 RepID=UPI000F8325FF|nr:hypothetical protein [Asticcacaulis excentricus]
MWNRIALFAAYICSSAGTALAQTPNAKEQSLEAICAATQCRAGGLEIVLRLNKDSYTPIPVGKSPFIMEDGALLIYPGETFAIQYDVVDGKPTAPRWLRSYAPQYPMKILRSDKVVDNAADQALPPIVKDNNKALIPPNSVLLSYGQLAGQTDMMLRVESTLPDIVKFDAVMALVAKGGGYTFKPTSTCPVANRLLFEHWPYPIGPIILKNIRFLPKDADLTCK